MNQGTWNEYKIVLMEKLETILAQSDIEAAAQRIEPFIHRTPVLTSQSIDEITGAKLFFKCENFQKIGAFKIRGALNTIFSLNEEACSRGVATHSSGNHAQAVALGAKLRNTSAWIVMPRTAPKVKRAAVEGYGATVITCEPTLEARESTLQKVVEETGAVFIHPYNDWQVIAGQATAGKELIEDTDSLDIVMAPVGGGGLLSGTALSTYYFSSGTQVIGAEPAGADDAYRSFTSGTLIPSINPKTIADGLLTSLGDKTFRVIRQYVDDILTVEEELIIQAMRLIWERMKIIIEPSCAIPLAVVLKYPERFADKKVGIIITGGNVDLDKLPF